MPVTRRQATAPQRQPSHKETNLQDRNKSSATSQNTYNENLEGQRASSSSSQGVCQRDDNVREQEPKLPFVELVFYAVCIVGIMLRANVYAVYAKSQDHISDFGSYNLAPGWGILGGRLRDISDFEWTYTKNLQFSIPFTLATVGYVVMGRVTDAYAPKLKVSTGLIYSLICLTYTVGWRVVLMFILHTIVTFLASRSRNTVVVWAVMLVQIAAINFQMFKTYQRPFFEDEAAFQNAIFGTAMSQLRLISFAVDCCRNNRRKEKVEDEVRPVSARPGWSLLDIMVYNFYLPLFIGGPVLTYDKFRNRYYQDPKPFTKQELLAIVKELLRYMFWMVLTDASLHFLYFPAFQQRKHLLIFLPDWAIGGIALNHLIFFQVKYIMLYGIPRTIAHFDRLDVPKPPICVLGTYLFSDFWRYFDRGLHELLMSCIYIPLGGSKHGLLRQLMSSLLCFAFVYYWHGSDLHLLYWALFNWIGVTMEQLQDMVIQKYNLDTLLKSKLSGANYMRLVGVLRTPAYICLAASNLVFLSGTNRAYVYFDRLLLAGWPYASITTFFLLYCFIQVVRELHRVYGKGYLCKKKYIA